MALALGGCSSSSSSTEETETGGEDAGTTDLGTTELEALTVPVTDQAQITIFKSPNSQIA